MPRYCVKVKGLPHTVSIDAATLERAKLGDEGVPLYKSAGDIVFKDVDGKEIAFFNFSEVAGCWPDSEGEVTVTVQGIGGQGSDCHDNEPDASGNS